MKSPSALERLPVWLMGALASLSAMTLAGWWLRFDELLQPFGFHPPLNLNAAVGLGILSAALFALEFGPRRCAAISTIATILGGATLIEQFSGRDLHIDQVFG